MTCPECGGALHVDAQHGEQVCSKCSTVWPLHDASSWLNQPDGVRDQEGPPRGVPAEAMRYDGKGRPLGNKELAHMRRLRVAAKHNAGRHDKQQTRRRNFEHAIQSVAQESQTPSWVVDDAMALLHALLKERFVYFPRYRVLAAALLVAAMRGRGMPVALHEAAASMGVSRVEMVRDLKAVRRIVPQARVQLDVVAMSRSYAQRLGCPDASDTAAELARQWLDPNENPLVVAAAACLHAAHQHGHNLAVSDVAQLACIKPGCLRTFLARFGKEAAP